jgi:protein-disulfide isomerase
MWQRVDQVGGIVFLILSAMLIGLFAHRELMSDSTVVLDGGFERGWTFKENWHDVVAVGHRLGSEDAPITLVEFGDFECPFCKRFAEHVHRLKERLGDSLAFVYVHYPLSRHRFAIPAARAAECAGEQGRFHEYHDALFAKQDSLGLKSWLSFAEDAGVSDIATFGKCVAEASPLPRVEAGRRLGDELGVQGTPSIILNGWFYPGGLQFEQLEEAIRTVMHHRDPNRTLLR